MPYTCSYSDCYTASNFHCMLKPMYTDIPVIAPGSLALSIVPTETFVAALVGESILTVVVLSQSSALEKIESQLL